jgi:hypothetical protein
MLTEARSGGPAEALSYQSSGRIKVDQSCCGERCACEKFDHFSAYKPLGTYASRGLGAQSPIDCYAAS